MLVAVVSRTIGEEKKKDDKKRVHVNKDPENIQILEERCHPDTLKMLVLLHFCFCFCLRKLLLFCSGPMYVYFSTFLPICSEAGFRLKTNSLYCLQGLLRAFIHLPKLFIRAFTFDVGCFSAVKFRSHEGFYYS